MGKIQLIVLLFMTGLGYSQNAEITISGVVSDGNQLLQGVNVSVKGTEKGTLTDEKGRYKMTVGAKEVLVFSFVGMETVEIMTEDVSRILNVEMIPKVEELEEVVVSKRKRITQKDLTQNYFKDASIIRTNNGYLSPNLVGYQLRVVDGKDLNRKAWDILDALQEQLPGTVVRVLQGERFLFQMTRGSLRGAPAVAYEVDGRVMEEAPVWLDIRTVIRAALIPSDQAVRLYGAIGVGGMVVINTNQVQNGQRDADGRPYDLAQLRNNVYKGDALDSEAILNSGPTYLKELYASKDVTEALERYRKFRPLYGDSYSFVLDMFTYFQENEDTGDTSLKVIEDNWNLFESNPLALQALAYHYQAYGMVEEAHELYKMLYKMRPEYAQSFMDLANSYRDLRDYKQSLTLYGRYEYLKKNDFLSNDSTAFQKIIEREYNNLISLKGNEILQKTDVKDEAWEEEFKGTRLVFEWNDMEAEFELQFVNPKGHYHKEVHSSEVSPSEIRNEKKTGYACKEFLIDESLVGKWQVNATYLGNRVLHRLI